MDQPAAKLPLTKRQNEILKLIQSGLSNKEVARKLAISDGTVKQHLVEAFRRLKVTNRTQAAQLVTQAEEGSFFLSPLQAPQSPRNRLTAKTATFAASLQPISCIKVHLHGSHSLLHQLGSAKFNQFNQHLRQACEQAATRFNGIVQGSIDGPLVLFGVRHMREDDPLRALCCAGMITQAMQKQSTTLSLKTNPIHITIHSDSVITCTNGQSTTIQGEFLTKIRPSAKANTPLILSSITEAAVNRLFARHGTLSPHLPGSECYPPTASTDLMADPIPPFVGRDMELESLHRKLAESIQGKSKALLVVGEAGFGETRLVHKFKEELTSRKEIRWLSGTCHSVAQMVAVHPFLPILETLAGCDLTASKEQRWEQLVQWIHSMPETLAKSGQYLLDLLQESIPAPKLAPGNELLEALTDFFITHFNAILPPAPSVVIVFLDNLHWMDSFSRVLLTHLASRLNDSSIWLMGAGRKAELRSLSNHSAWHSLSLSRLPDRDILRLLKHMPIARRLESEQLNLLVDWCRGVPLFAVEIAHHLINVRKSALHGMIHAGDLFPDSLLCMILERVHALVGVDQKVLHALAAGSKEITLQQLLKLNLHGDAQATQAVVTHLHQTGLLKITALGTEQIISFGNEMVRAALRKTLPASDLV